MSNGEYDGTQDWNERVARENALEQRRAERDAEEAAKREEKIRDARLSGVSLFQCNGCETLWEEEELVPLRECPHCNHTFDATDGRNCTICNRPFTSKVSDAGCPDCLSDEELELVDLTEK